MHGSMRGAGSWGGGGCLCSWVGAFVYRWVACCTETAQRLGSVDKHLGYALNKLSVAFPLPILFTSQTHFGAFGLLGWTGRFWAAGGGGLGGRAGFQSDVGLFCLAFQLMALFFLCLGGWMAWSLWSACDESGLQMRSRVCDAQGSAPCVGNSTQRRDCNEIPGESVRTSLGGL